MASAAWISRPGCAPHYRLALERAVNAAPVAWRKDPVTGEVFESLVEAEKRLKLYSLASGFDLVRKGGGTKQIPGNLFLCIHHGAVTLNTRGLEDRVVRDD